MAKVAPDLVKRFLTEEILNGPLAEFISAEPLRLYLEQYLMVFFKEGVLHLEGLITWLESEHGASAGTVQLFFERLQAKGQRQGIVLLLPGQKAPSAPIAQAGAGPAPPAEPSEGAKVPASLKFKADDIIRLSDRSAFVGMGLSGREKSLLIFLDGVRTLAQASVPTKMSLEEIGEFLQKYWSLGKFQWMNPTPAPADAAPAAPVTLADIEYPLLDELPHKYERKAIPTEKKGKAAPAKAKPFGRVAAPVAAASGRQKAVAVAVLVAMLLTGAWAVHFVIKTRASHVKINHLNAADYASILPLTNAEQMGQVFIGTLDAGRWSRLSRGEKLDACAKLYKTLKGASVTQIQLRASGGEILVLIYNENRISFLR